MPKITFEVTDETYYRLELLKNIVNYEKNNIGKLATNEIAKAALLHYLNRFYPYKTGEVEIENLIPLGSDGELIITLGEFLEENVIIPSHLANEVKISRQTISGIINHKKIPSLDTFIRIWTVLGCPPLHKLLKREAKGSQSIVD